MSGSTKTARISASRNKHHLPELHVRPPVGSYLTDDWESCTIAMIGLLELTERRKLGQIDASFIYGDAAGVIGHSAEEFFVPVALRIQTLRDGK